MNGYSGWFLPSKNELNVMYWTIGPGAPAPLTNIGGFSSELYWSSSEDNSITFTAWFKGFDFGVEHIGHKSWTLTVRAVRAF